MRSKTKRSVAYELMEWNIDDGIPKPKVQRAAQGRLTAVYCVDSAADRSDTRKICQYGSDKIFWKGAH